MTFPTMRRIASSRAPGFGVCTDLCLDSLTHAYHGMPSLVQCYESIVVRSFQASAKCKHAGGQIFAFEYPMVIDEDHKRYYKQRTLAS